MLTIIREHCLSILPETDYKEIKAINIRCFYFLRRYNQQIIIKIQSYYSEIFLRYRLRPCIFPSLLYTDNTIYEFSEYSCLGICLQMFSAAQLENRKIQQGLCSVRKHIIKLLHNDVATPLQICSHYTRFQSLQTGGGGGGRRDGLAVWPAYCMYPLLTHEGVHVCVHAHLPFLWLGRIQLRSKGWGHLLYTI